ncbi:uncharacterized protein [Spinacia oleracea]|uniref:Helitron helicase-like domain-containing protein n=1 Tax=Spinacia oleracea TaxID=3562 RepID=A0ABM3R233_SPIOL|nr:uncharacterized protein LOC130464195 [Spinacia oleracea]
MLIVLLLKQGHKMTSAEFYDKFVCPELPDQNENPHLYTAVVKHMIHGPCGKLNPTNACMNKDGKCKNNYPKSFCFATVHGKKPYPVYRRRDNGKQVKVRGQILDNRWVVPYNPYLLAKFDCHINVEICSTVEAVKYLYKYIYKGHDRVAFHVYSNETKNEIDEIEQYQSGRWVSPPEAMWRIYKFALHEIYPSVQSLQLHLEGKQLVTFRNTDNLNVIVENDSSKETMLTQYFYMNKMKKNPKNLLYKQFPKEFVWNSQSKTWNKRGTKKTKKVIGRVVTANPIEGERYYLRILLNHIGTSTSFDDLKTLNNKKANTFHEAALMHGLLHSDNSLDLCLQEATMYRMPCSLRRLF